MTRAAVKICMGGGCRKEGAKETRDRLEAIIAERGLQDQIKVEKCGCLKACGKGPVVSVEGETEIRVKHAKAKKAEKLVDNLTGDMRKKGKKKGGKKK